MPQPLTSNRLSLLNLKRRPFRTVALILVVTILSFVLFGGTILSLSLQNGLNSVEARFGSDLIVVPLGYEGKQESILLTGEPSYFYFDKSVADHIQGVKGISKLSEQFYLTSLSASCCSLPVQIVGFDPATDFTIQPWIRETIGGNLESGALIVGSDILTENHQIKLFDKEYPVAAKLDKTGTGMDQSVFATIETIQDLFYRAREKGMYFLEGTNPDTSVSSVLIQVEKGYSIDQVATNIRRVTDGIQIVKKQNMITAIADSLDGFITFFYLFAIAFLVVALVVLTAVFTVTANERKKEFATLRTLGATQKRLANVLLGESLCISAAGGVIGVALAAMLIFPFSVFIGDSIGLPYVQPSPLSILGVLAATMLLSVVIGPIASAYSAYKISRAETYLTLRDGE